MNFDIPDVYRKTLNNNSKCYSSLNGFFSIGHLMLVHRNSNSCIPFIDWSSIKVNEQRVPDLFYSPSLDFPCVVSLLCGKTADVYRQLFYELQEYADRLDMKFEPSHIMSDFEISLIKAVRQKVRFSWLKTTIQCYIHRFRWPNITDISSINTRDMDFRCCWTRVKAWMVLMFTFVHMCRSYKAWRAAQTNMERWAFESGQLHAGWSRVHGSVAKSARPCVETGPDNLQRQSY